MKFTYFAINFSFAILMLDACIIGIVIPFYSSDSGPAIVGAFMLLFPSARFAWMEWALFYREQRSLERRSGIYCLVLSGFAGFGVVANVAEAMGSGNTFPNEFGWFVAIGIGISAYLAVCGFVRLRRARDWARHQTGDKRKASGWTDDPLGEPVC